MGKPLVIASVIVLASLYSTAARAQPRPGGIVTGIQQDGQNVRARDGVVRLRRAPFTLVLSLPATTSVKVHVAADAKGYDLARTGRPLDEVYPDGGAYAEADFNGDRALTLSDDTSPGYHFWYYDSEADHRFDSVAARGSNRVARRTAVALTAPDRVRYTLEQYPGSELYVTLLLVGARSSAEVRRDAVRIVFTGEPTPPGFGAAPGVEAGGPVRLSPDQPPPRKVIHVNPVYPPDALAARRQGTVVVEAMIGLDGAVEDTKVVRSIPMFDAAALDAVRQWRFEPFLINGMPTRVIMTVTVGFSLK
jgi:TonB family protein